MARDLPFSYHICGFDIESWCMHTLKARLHFLTISQTIAPYVSGQWLQAI